MVKTLFGGKTLDSDLWDFALVLHLPQVGKAVGDKFPIAFGLFLEDIK